MDRDVYYAALLIGLFIAGAYFVGLSTDFNSVANGVVKLVNALQGKNAQGNLPGYPSGATQVQGG